MQKSLAYKSYRQKADKLNRPKDIEAYRQETNNAWTFILKEKTNYLLLMLKDKYFLANDTPPGYCQPHNWGRQSQCQGKTCIATHAIFTFFIGFNLI
jgi:hypothetical protein